MPFFHSAQPPSPFYERTHTRVFLAHEMDTETKCCADACIRLPVQCSSDAARSVFVYVAFLYPTLYFSLPFFHSISHFPCAILSMPLSPFNGWALCVCVVYVSRFSLYSRVMLCLHSALGYSFGCFKSDSRDNCIIVAYRCIKRVPILSLQSILPISLMARQRALLYCGGFRLSPSFDTRK